MPSLVSEAAGNAKGSSVGIRVGKGETGRESKVEGGERVSGSACGVAEKRSFTANTKEKLSAHRGGCTSVRYLPNGICRPACISRRLVEAFRPPGPEVHTRVYLCGTEHAEGKGR